MLAQAIPLATSAVTLVTMWAAGSQHRWAWALGLANQTLWAAFIITYQAWGLAPLTAALTVVYTRNYLRWRRTPPPPTGFAPTQLRGPTQTLPPRNTMKPNNNPTTPPPHHHPPRETPTPGLADPRAETPGGPVVTAEGGSERSVALGGPHVDVVAGSSAGVVVARVRARWVGGGRVALDVEEVEAPGWPEAAAPPTTPAVGAVRGRALAVAAATEEAEDWSGRPSALLAAFAARFPADEDGRAVGPHLAGECVAARLGSALG